MNWRRNYAERKKEKKTETNWNKKEKWTGEEIMLEERKKERKKEEKFKRKEREQILFKITD